jgi:alkanesulfonate monooxygenase SsuD/methylene tetrahydromethanopterin reductase-like flavin-dependent oxidoreductase (luciferase family)
MKFYAFHLMPYPDLVSDYREKYGSAWITYSNENYDPAVGRAAYDRYIGELTLAAEIGFDGICVNEHHQTSYGMMPSPNLIAAMLIERTRHMSSQPEIAILGNAIPLRGNPLRIAEEIAMLDIMSGGRVISGFVRGIGAEYHVFGLSPSESHGRFFEAHDLIVKAWTEPGPFAWEGEYYNFRYVNPWPTPFQKPHPPIWSPSTGSAETIDWAAERGYAYLQTAAPLSTIGAFYDQYRATSERAGRPNPGSRLAWNVPVYVAESDAQAEDEFWPGLDRFHNELFMNPPHRLFPPNYLSETSYERVTGSRLAAMAKKKTFKDIVDQRLAIVGSAETVLGQIEEAHEALGFGNIITHIQIGSTSHERTVASMQRFAQDVMPKLRPLEGR